MTKKQLLAQAIKSEDFNTNNGWGFGGSIGTTYTFKNNVKLVLRKICYRHAPSNNVHEVYHNGELIIDGYTGLNKSSIIHIEKLIK